MIPVIALIGRSNVGKSTLFNQLTRICDALVADIPGITRDRKYGCVKLKGRDFIVIDTGGIDDTYHDKEIKKNILNQSILAIKEADIVLFVVDGSAGIIAADKNIASYLRRLEKIKVIVVANKIDRINAYSAVENFCSLGLGGNIVPISALYRRGINRLLEDVLLPILKESSLVSSYTAKKQFLLKKEPFNHNQQSLPIKLAIVGRPNVGKSTLINQIIGENRMIVYDLPGTTRDSIYIPIVISNRAYVLIDTAGVRKRSKVIRTVEKISIIKTMQAIDDANVVLLIIDACEGVLDQDLSLLRFISKSGRSLVIAVNKWDLLSIETRYKIKKMLSYRLSFISFIRIHFISALYGIGVSKLFKSVNEAYNCATKKISTGLLTKIMHMAVDKNLPPIVHGKRVKPKYAHVGGYNPPIVVIHGTNVQYLPDTYKRYLINFFCRSLKIIGTPIQIQLKTGTKSICKENQ